MQDRATSSCDPGMLRRAPLKSRKDYVLSPDVSRTDSALEAPLVFVGYGVTAPELRYDDYAGVDVRGKIVVVLDGTPSKFTADQRAHFLVHKRRTALDHGAAGLFAVIPGLLPARAPTGLLNRSALRHG